MLRRYYEIEVDAPELPLRQRRFQIVVSGDQNPADRAIKEGLLKPANLAKARCREISREECLRRWHEAKFQLNHGKVGKY